MDAKDTMYAMHYHDKVPGKMSVRYVSNFLQKVKKCKKAENHA